MIRYHSCTKKFDDGHTETCAEEKDFTLWCDDGAERKQVDFCPICGFKAAFKRGDPPYVYKKVSQSEFGKETLAALADGTISTEVAEAFRSVIDKDWDEVMNNPHILNIRGTFMDPNITEDRAKLAMVGAMSNADAEEEERVKADRVAKQVDATKNYEEKK